MHTISDIIADAPIDRIDTELLIAAMLDADRTWILTHPDHVLSDEQEKALGEKIHRRQDHEPLAYILGYKEFYGRRFHVTPDTLVPRPESELFVDILKDQTTPNSLLLDIGTGSGCIGISCALEIPQIENTILTDIDEKALRVAAQNAQELAPSTTFHILQSDLLSRHSLQEKIAVLTSDDTTIHIAANLPYVDRTWQPQLLQKDTSRGLAFEPDHALWADESGIALYRTLLSQLATLLPTLPMRGLHLLLEINDHQHDLLIPVIEKTLPQGTQITAHRDLAGHRRIISIACNRM